MQCSKCGFEGGRDNFRFSGNANPSGNIAFRKCPKCGHLEPSNEFLSDEEYKGPQPWGLNRFRGHVFKGKKKTVKQI